MTKPEIKSPSGKCPCQNSQEVSNATVFRLICAGGNARGIVPAVVAMSGNAIVFLFLEIQ